MFCSHCHKDGFNPQLKPYSKKPNHKELTALLYLECCRCGRKYSWFCSQITEIKEETQQGRRDLIDQVLTPENLASEAFLSKLKEIIVSKKITRNDLIFLNNSHAKHSKKKGA